MVRHTVISRIFRRKSVKKFDLTLNLLYNYKNSKMVFCTPELCNI